MISARNQEAADKFVNDFVNRIKLEMKKQNISHNKMVENVGCTPNHFNRLLQQTKLLSADKMVDIASAIGYEIKISFHKKS